MISIQQEQQWRREYLQKMRDILNDARGKYNLERLKELYPEDAEELDDLEGDDIFVFKFLLEVIAPILSLVPFIEKNVPAPQTKGDEEGKGFFPRYTLSEIFDYLSSITDYGKYRLLNQFPGDDDAYQELEKALFSNDKEKFIQIVKDRKLDFSEFRRRIEGNIYFATGTEELIARLIVPFSGQITGEDELNRWGDDLEELGEIMSQHSPQTVYRYVKEIKGIGKDLWELPKDEIDFDMLQRISGLHLSNEDVVHMFSVSVYFFLLYSIFFCSVLKDDELKVINDFLDGFENRRVLNGIKRVLYVALEGNLTIDENCNLNTLFLGQGFKEELKTQNIDALVREFHPKPQITLAPDEQEQPEPQPTLAPTEGKKQDGEGGMKKIEDVPHWPTEEELKNYDLNHNDAEFFTESIFGIAKSVKASDVEQLYNVLISKDVQVLDDTLEAKLIFLARYTGRSIPGLELKPLKWCYTASERDKALGYLIKTTAGAKFAKGIRFFYYDDNGQKTKPEREPVAQGGNSWALAGRKETTRTLFERELNKFLIMYPDDKE